MKPTSFIAAAIAAATLAGTPSLAGDWRDDRRSDWREDRRSDWRNDRRDGRHDQRAQREAYNAGYRAGRQANGYWHQGRWVTTSRPAQGQGRGYGWNGNPNFRPDAWRPTADSRQWVQGRDYWYGQDGRGYCRRADGTTGSIVGAAAGGTLGTILAGPGDRTVGSVIGGTLGAILGREIARGDARCR